MYLLPYLKEAAKMGGQPYDFDVEYRLACSGEFYNSSVGVGTWRSFEMARLLLERPFALYVVSRPFDRFPQELCLRLGLNWIMEHQPGGGSIGSSPPYDELVEDICAVLTLLSRRLVIPAFEARVLFSRDREDMRADSFRYDVPSPILGLGNVGSRGLRLSRSERKDGTVTIVEHTPPALRVDSGALERAFLSLSQGQHASGIIQAARAYSSALQLILVRPEVAYQLLISAVETLASGVFSDYRPSRDDMIERKHSVASKAKSFGLSAEQADDLALEACKDDSWAGRKFKEFFRKYSSEETWEPDDMFPLAEGWEPERKDIGRVLSAIYTARSKHLHEGKEFPEWIAHQATVAVPGSFYSLPGPAEYVPPVTWFERLVSSAIRCLLAAESDIDYKAPFVGA